MSTLQTPDDPGAPTDAAPPGVEIRLLHDAADMTRAGDVLKQVWGSVTDLVPLEMMMAIDHSGGYVSAAYEIIGDDERILGASVAILARHRGRPALHSHVTGLLPGARRHGVGRAIKMHQKQWAADNDIEWIVWTFDPLVRRNAWFNLAVLGAEVDEYLVSFYGTMSDAINAGDESDRLLVGWDVRSEVGAEIRDGNGADVSMRIPTPEDIVTLRRTDPDAVRGWRHRTREAWSSALEAGRPVLGFSREGEYLLGDPR